MEAGVKEAWLVDPVVISYNQWLNRRNGKRVRAFNVLSNFWPSGRLRARSRDGELHDYDFREARKRAVRDGPSRLRDGLPEDLGDGDARLREVLLNRWAAGIPNVVYPAWSILGVYHGICLTYSCKVPLLYLCVSM